MDAAGLSLYGKYQATVLTSNSIDTVVFCRRRKQHGISGARVCRKERRTGRI